MGWMHLRTRQTCSRYGHRDTARRRRAGYSITLPACLLALLLVAGFAASGCAPSPSARVAPTPTPATPRARLAARVAQIAQAAGATSQISDDAAQQSIVITIALSGAVPRFDDEIARAQALVKSLCFQAQRGAWTSDLALTTVKVSVLGPILDDYADLITRGYGGAIVTSATAAKFAWASLDATSAWSRYDQVWLSSEFSPYQRFHAPPAATPTPS